MSEALALMQVLLGHRVPPTAVRDLLEQALSSGADPLRWCAAHCGLTENEVMARAAAWAGLTFFDVVPRQHGLDLTPSRLEALAEVRIHRVRVKDLEMTFAAPDFAGVLRLARAVQERPEMAGNICLVSEAALRDFLVQHAHGALMDGARQNLSRYWPRAAAHLALTGATRYGFALALILATLLILLLPLTGVAILAPIWFVLVMTPSLLRLMALAGPAPQEVVEDNLPQDMDLPDYSILVPLRDEANMVGQLCQTLGQLDYPSEKLQVLFVVESRSPATIKALRPFLRDQRFALRVVPDARPRTKPKALDFALPLCRGEFVVVYDAEDRPEPDQLRRVVAQFRRQRDVHCIQARLVIDNGRDGVLPAMFAGEYAGLFSVLLPALARWGVVMPLGGTSNHFRIASLRGLGGWDAFNVTEDADLGVRLARRKLRCATTTSRTYEAAPVRLKPWLGQRTRWVKGWIQTYAVHNRYPRALLADVGQRGMLALQVVLLGMVLAPLLHAGFLIMLPILVVTGHFTWSGWDLWAVLMLAVPVLGSVAAIATNLVGLQRTGQSALILWQILLPAYWALIGLATLLAMWDFMQRPFHWFKTPHQVQRAAADGSRQMRAFRALKMGPAVTPRETRSNAVDGTRSGIVRSPDGRTEDRSRRAGWTG